MRQSWCDRICISVNAETSSLYVFQFVHRLRANFLDELHGQFVDGNLKRTQRNTKKKHRHRAAAATTTTTSKNMERQVKQEFIWIWNCLAWLYANRIWISKMFEWKRHFHRFFFFCWFLLSCNENYFSTATAKVEEKLNEWTQQHTSRKKQHEFLRIVSAALEPLISAMPTHITRKARAKATKSSHRNAIFTDAAEQRNILNT